MPEKLVKFRLRRKSQENMSASTSDKRIRVETEMYFVLQKFATNFTDNKFFLEVFPKADKFVVNGDLNFKFAFAKICLENQSTPFNEVFQFVGLEILKNLLSDEKSATQIKNLYNYDEKSFLLDTGKYDVFNLQQKFSMLNCEIYFDDGGEDFIFADKKIVYVENNGNFFAKFNFNTARTVKFLRFDPDDKFTSIKIFSCKVNGKNFLPTKNNAVEIVEDFYRFLTDDPQLVFEVENLTGEIIFEVQGTVERNFSTVLTKSASTLQGKISTLVGENINLHNWGKDLETANKNLAEQNNELQNWNQDLETANKNLAEQNNELQTWNQDLETANKNLAGDIHTLQSQVSDLEKVVVELGENNNNFRRRIGELEGFVAELQNKKAESDNEILVLRNANFQLHMQNVELNKFKDAVENSNSWKITSPLRTFGRWAKYSNKDKVLSVVRTFYKAVPLGEETKTDLKDKFYTSLAPLIKDTQKYKVWQQNKIAFRNQQLYVPAKFVEWNSKKFDGEFFPQPGKIAIHAHIFYLDLVEEIANYFSNMPYKFDALISIIDSSAEEKIKSVFSKVGNIENLIVRVVPNRGRDVAPFIVGFGDILKNYDFVAHIHSKKSLYTGSEQQKWRHYLFDALLGRPELIRKIFKAFKDNENVGLIYPRPAENVPYQAFTWMSNTQIGHYLLNKIGVPLNITDYFDFPAGTMFWARSDALKKFYNNLKLEDFPEEQGQNDGTIAHAFERSVALAVNSEGMEFYEFDPGNESYTINIGSKSLWQYWNKTGEEIGYILQTWDYVTFDIFDTLMMRYIAKPNLVNELIRLKVEKLLGSEFDFPKFRLQAESVAREKFSHDVNIAEIYKTFSELTKLDEETCKKIRALEVETEIELALPRTEIVDWLKKCVAANKKVYLISDMYLQTEDIEKILSKCDIEGYNKLMISCETGMRKDTAEVWNYLAEKKLAGNLIHIGDNEQSDVQVAGDRKFDTCHVMSAINLFSQTHFGLTVLNRLGRNISPYAGMLMGTFLAKEFNNPFKLKNPGAVSCKYQVKNFHELGYTFYGVPLLTFILWLIKKTAEDDTERILFLARDGYFLQPLYKLVTKLLKIDELENNYFYASRRAVTVAGIRKISQAYDLLTLKFEGTVKKFFDVRFGIEIDDDREIALPNEDDKKIVQKIIDDNAEKILKRAEDERKNYEKYISSLGGNFEKVGVVDMGYSGTIQYHLQRLMNKTFKGYYFATSATNLFRGDPSKAMQGCFTENDDYGFTKSAVYRYQLLFEAILTAPDAQLQYFDADGKPIFGMPEPAQKNIKEIAEVYEGIQDFCRDVLEHFGEYILKFPIDFNFADAWVRGFVHDGQTFSDEVKKIFAFDDEYCNTFTGNAVDLYLHGFNGVSYKIVY